MSKSFGENAAYAVYSVKYVTVVVSLGVEAYAIKPLEERPIRAVLRGIPSIIREEDTHEDLMAKGFHPSKMIRMLHPITKKPMPMVLIELTRNRENEKIFDLAECCGITIRIETLKFQGNSQCYRCNRFGHTASQCLSAARCLKCGKNHETRDCALEKLDTPTCINCGAEGHTAAWRKCPSFPKRT